MRMIACKSILQGNIRLLLYFEKTQLLNSNLSESLRVTNLFSRENGSPLSPPGLAVAKDGFISGQTSDTCSAHTADVCWKIFREGNAATRLRHSDGPRWLPIPRITVCHSCMALSDPRAPILKNWTTCNLTIHTTQPHLVQRKRHRPGSCSKGICSTA